MTDIDKEFLHLSRLCLEGKQSDSTALIRRALREIGKRRPDLTKHVDKVLSLAGSSSSLRSLAINPDPIPVDADTRLHLLRRESVVNLDFEPLWTESIRVPLESVIAERLREPELAKAGLAPTKSMLLVGPPGVGKTLSARWLAMKLDRPLLVLDLAAVMSSYLGKTGNNIRSVLEFAQKNASILLLDEFDAIAKRRDDAGEIGELKRLVTVLLQTVDDWPTDGLLLAATNHPELLDPAVWRRFDRIVEFPKPTNVEQQKYIKSLLPIQETTKRHYAPILAAVFDGLSYAEIEKKIKALLREAIIGRNSIESHLDHFIANSMRSFDIEKRLNCARTLERQGKSQREIHELTGCSRDTLREHGIGVKSKTSSTQRTEL